MATKSVEERLQRIEDILEIQNIMGKYPYYVMAGMQAEIGEKFFAKKASGIRVYFGEQGYWEGPDAPQRAGGGVMAGGTEEERQARRVGMMAMHCPICPVVEVARDGKTAKGVWISDGMETGRNSVTGQLDPHWAWGAYGVDFINEGGEWKFWHFHIYRLFAPHYNVSWVEWEADAPPSMMPRGQKFQLKTDGPAVDDRPYRANEVFVFKPDPPEPYETWDDTFTY